MGIAEKVDGVVGLVKVDGGVGVGVGFGVGVCVSVLNSVLTVSWPAPFLSFSFPLLASFLMVSGRLI